MMIDTEGRIGFDRSVYPRSRWNRLLVDVVTFVFRRGIAESREEIDKEKTHKGGKLNFLLMRAFSKGNNSFMRYIR